MKTLESSNQSEIVVEMRSHLKKSTIDYLQKHFPHKLVSFFIIHKNYKKKNAIELFILFPKYMLLSLCIYMLWPYSNSPIITIYCL